jgi:ribosomal protein S18 acetylase RimI-like enzyme
VSQLAIAEMTHDDVDAVTELWHRAGNTRPWNDPGADIAFAMRSPNSTLLVGRENGMVVATVMVGHDGHRGTVYYVAVHPEHQRKGFGGAIMAAAESWLRNCGIWKMNLLIRAGNLRAVEFYEAIGFEEQPRIYMEKWLDERRRGPG